MSAKKPLYIVRTTDDIKHLNLTERVKARDEIAKMLAQKYNLPVIDLHTVAVNNSEYHRPDGVHFENEGYVLFAKCILESIG